jgi:hypothetical protein
MKRRSIFAALALFVGKASGQAVEADRCPVCRTSAAPYVLKRAGKGGVEVGDTGGPYACMNGCRHIPEGHIIPDVRLTGHKSMVVGSQTFEYSDPPTSRVTRCLRCNNAFWQDAR